MNRNTAISFAIFLLIPCLVSFACSKKDKWENISTSGNKTSKTDELPKSEIKSGGFQGNLPNGFQMPNDSVGKKILKEYGALFVAKGDATTPNSVVFKTNAEVSNFQAGIAKSSENFGGISVE